MAGIREFLQRWVFPYLPYPHFMGLAPLDSVLALLFRTRPNIPVALWPRLAVLLFFSALSTLLSLPERLAIALWLRFRPRHPAPHEAPVFVLGYFRSGTTWLQTLLSLDPALRSPIWLEALSPHTFVVTWTVLRVLLAPFLMLVRIRAVSPLGATLPAEDDFALCNWARTSVIAGRAMFPEQQDFYNRFHDLDRLTAAERARWERHERAFVGKLLLTAEGPPAAAEIAEPHRPHPPSPAPLSRRQVHPHHAPATRRLPVEPRPHQGPAGHIPPGPADRRRRAGGDDRGRISGDDGALRRRPRPDPARRSCRTAACRTLPPTRSARSPASMARSASPSAMVFASAW